MIDFILQELRKPYGILIPWLALVLLLAGVLWAVRNVGIDRAEQSRAKLELEWNQARHEYSRHKEARKARKDLAQVWAVLPVERDFAPLALGITEASKRDRVSLPALSYKTEPTLVANTSKGVLQGTMTGRYEDLRRFLYDVETAEEMVYIEDLELVRSGAQQDQTLTFNIKIATYLRGETDKATVQ
ncbi:MAG: type 4a pilus biogenesis protein PilO [Nitrospirota bacterium]